MGQPPGPNTGMPWQARPIPISSGCGRKKQPWDDVAKRAKKQDYRATIVQFGKFLYTYISWFTLNTQSESDQCIDGSRVSTFWPRWKRHDQHMERRQAVRLCSSSPGLRTGRTGETSEVEVRLIIDDYWLDLMIIRWFGWFTLIIDDDWLLIIIDDYRMVWIILDYLRLLPVWKSQENPGNVKQVLHVSGFLR